jgi:hypothetical protein
MAGDPPVKGWALHRTIAGVLIVGHDRFLMYYGTELTSAAVLRWVLGRVMWHYIEPGKPVRMPSLKASTIPAPFFRRTREEGSRVCLDVLFGLILAPIVCVANC